MMPKQRSGPNLVSSNQKRVSNRIMKLQYSPPGQIPHKIVVFVLSRTVVSMEMSRSFSESMILEIMVDIADSSVCPFSDITGFIDQIVYLPRDRFAHHSKNSTFTQRFKVNGPGLHWIAGYMNLLCKIKGIVHSSCQRTRFTRFLKVYLVFQFFKIILHFASSQTFL